jgi:hypothetical protein
VTYQAGAFVPWAATQSSSLVQLGAMVLSWREYYDLLDLLARVVDGYQHFYPAKTNFTLDFEYKKVYPGRLEVKQVRPLPRPDSNQRITAFVLNEPTGFCTFQGELRDEWTGISANHRLKTRLLLSTRNMRLTQTNLATGFYTTGRFEYVVDGSITNLPGSLADWPNATHEVRTNQVLNRWTVGEGAARRDYELVTPIAGTQTTPQAPVMTVQDLAAIFLNVRYATPQRAVGGDGRVVLSTNETIRLTAFAQASWARLRQQRNFAVGEVQIQTEFDWPEPPEYSAGYTAPLVAWKETRITGLIAEPIVLRGYYSQTYATVHHNFVEAYIFEPRLEPGLASQQMNELEQANVQLIYVFWDWTTARIFILELDSQVRRVE